jgi:hypothetical protein
MKITIFGATGKTGQLVVQYALAAGHEVTAYVRNPEKLGEPRPRLTIVEDSLQNSEAIERAVAGQNAVISLLGPTGKTSGMPVSDGMKLIVTAMQKQGVSRLIATATPSAADPADRFSLSFRLAALMVQALAGTAYQDIVRTAEIIRSSPLLWTLVRLPMLSDKVSPKTVAAGYIGDPCVKLFSLSRQALAQFLLAQLTDETWIRKAPAVSNG